LIRAEPTSRPEAAFVLVLMQSLFWAIAGLSAALFVLGGEIHMGALALVTLLLALGTVICAIGVLWRRRWARACAITLEVMSLASAALLLWLPIGFNHGIVSVLVNAVLPIAVIVLLAKDQKAFS
jgi:hypothetical protein